MNPCPPQDACPCQAHCCVPDSETGYEVSFGNASATWLDTAANGTLSNRVAIEIYNDGTIDFQVLANNPAFSYGQGRTIKAGASWLLTVGPGVRHYALCSASGPCSCHITELGKNFS
jgi:hypothetical protein